MTARNYLEQMFIEVFPEMVDFVERFTDEILMLELFSEEEPTIETAGF